MRVLLVSDTHGAIDPAILALAGRCEQVVHAGDIGSAAVLAALGPRVTAVRGNNDVAAKCAAADWEVLSALPLQASVSLPGGVLVVVHGHGERPASERHARLRRRFPDARAVLYGHSHRADCDLSARPWVLNPGAGGRARTHGGASCLVLEATARQWSVRLHRVGPGESSR